MTSVSTYLRHRRRAFKIALLKVIAIMLLAAIPVTGGWAQSETGANDATDNPLPLSEDATAPGDLGSPIDLNPSILSPTLNLVATLAEDGEPITFGIVWRVYATRPNELGQYPLLEKTDTALPTFRLQPGSYIVHAAYGRAQATEAIELTGEAQTVTVTLDAGGLRIWADLGRGARSKVRDVRFMIYSSEQDQYGDRKLIAETTEVGKLIRLNKGTYHIVSHYGEANAIVRADVLVEPGKITDATILHRAAHVTLKLVTETGGEALANTQWSVLTPGGDQVTETIGAFPTYVLAEGEYEAIARHDEVVYNKTFSVEAGIDREVELLAE